MYRYWQIPKKTPRDIVLSQYNENYKLLENKLVKDVEKAGGRYEFKTADIEPTRTTSKLTTATTPPPAASPPPISSTESINELKPSSSPSIRFNFSTRPQKRLMDFNYAEERGKYSDILDKLDKIKEDENGVKEIRNIAEYMGTEIEDFDSIYTSTIEQINTYEKYNKEYKTRITTMEKDMGYNMIEIIDRGKELVSVGENYRTIFLKILQKIATMGSLENIAKLVLEIFDWVFTSWKNLRNQRFDEMLSTLTINNNNNNFDNDALTKTLCGILLKETDSSRIKYFDKNTRLDNYNQQISNKYIWVTHEVVDFICHYCILICGKIILLEPGVTVKYTAENDYDQNFDSIYTQTNIAQKKDEIKLVMWPKVLTTYQGILYKGIAVKTPDEIPLTIAIQKMKEEEEKKAKEEERKTQKDEELKQQTYEKEKALKEKRVREQREEEEKQKKLDYIKSLQLEKQTIEDQIIDFEKQERELVELTAENEENKNETSEEKQNREQKTKAFLDQLRLQKLDFKEQIKNIDQTLDNLEMTTDVVVNNNDVNIIQADTDAKVQSGHEDETEEESNDDDLNATALINTSLSDLNEKTPESQTTQSETLESQIPRVGTPEVENVQAVTSESGISGTGDVSQEAGFSGVAQPGVGTQEQSEKN